MLPEILYPPTHTLDHPLWVNARWHVCLDWRDRQERPLAIQQLLVIYYTDSNVWFNKSLRFENCIQNIWNYIIIVFFSFNFSYVVTFFSATKGLNARAPWSPAPTPWSTPTPSAHASAPASSQTGAAPSWTATAKCQRTTPSDAPRPESVPAAAAAWQTDEFPPSEPSTANNGQQAENGETFFIFYQSFNKQCWHSQR